MDRIPVKYYQYMPCIGKKERTQPVAQSHSYTVDNISLKLNLLLKSNYTKWHYVINNDVFFNISVLLRNNILIPNTISVSFICFNLSNL